MCNSRQVAVNVKKVAAVSPARSFPKCSQFFLGVTGFPTRSAGAGDWLIVGKQLTGWGGCVLPRSRCGGREMRANDRFGRRPTVCERNSAAYRNATVVGVEVGSTAAVSMPTASQTSSRSWRGSVSIRLSQSGQDLGRPGALALVYMNAPTITIDAHNHRRTLIG